MTELLGRGYLGGGSIAAICGLSPFATPLDAFFAIVEPRSVEAAQEAFFRRRKALEPFAIQCFEEHTALKVLRTNHRYVSSRAEWARAEIDFEVTDWNGETKTVNEAAKHLWDDPATGAPPPSYVELQCQWGLDIHPAEGCYVHALIGLDIDWIYEVSANAEAVEIAWKRARDFWQFHVEKRRPPQPTTVEDILKLYPRDSGRKVEVTDAVADELDKISRIKTDIAFRTNAKERHEFAVKDFMRDAAVLTQRGKPIATFKTDKRGIRSLRIL